MLVGSGGTPLQKIDALRNFRQLWQVVAPLRLSVPLQCKISNGHLSPRPLVKLIYQFTRLSLITNYYKNYKCQSDFMVWPFDFYQYQSPKMEIAWSRCQKWLMLALTSYQK